MALSTQSANLVWQKVKIALAGADPAVARVFADLKAHLAQIKGNPDLQFISFIDADITGTDGVVAADAACQLYAIYVKKDGTSGTGTATDAWLKAFDDATDDGTTGDARVAIPLLVAADKAVYVDPDGLTMGTGVVLTAHTTMQGTTDSTAGDAGNGFILISA